MGVCRMLVCLNKTEYITCVEYIAILSELKQYSLALEKQYSQPQNEEITPLWVLGAHLKDQVSLMWPSQ